MIRQVGELHFKDLEFKDEMIIFLQEKGFLLEPIYADKLIVAVRIYEITSGLEKT